MNEKLKTLKDEYKNYPPSFEAQSKRSEPELNAFVIASEAKQSSLLNTMRLGCRVIVSPPRNDFLIGFVILLLTTLQ
jgi:hypothetical protein